MTLDVLILALLLGPGADPQAHLAPPAQAHGAPAKTEPAKAAPAKAAPAKAETPKAEPAKAEPAKAEAAKAAHADAARPAEHKDPKDPKDPKDKHEPKESEPKDPKPQQASKGTSDLSKLVAELKAVREAAAANKAKPTSVASRPRSAAKPGAGRPSAPRYQVKWPELEERWRLAWPQSPIERLALVWPE